MNPDAEQDNQRPLTPLVLDSLREDNPAILAELRNSYVLEDEGSYRISKRSIAGPTGIPRDGKVLTPTWMHNRQNNRLDHYPSLGQVVAFNTESADGKDWVPTSALLDFTDYEQKRKLKAGVGRIAYVQDRRLVPDCGEALCLVSPYDATTGLPLPVRDEKGRFLRVGQLDRKLRVANELFDNPPSSLRLKEFWFGAQQGFDHGWQSKEVWLVLVHKAFAATYGYERQGDSLLLARLNLLNTFRDYYWDRWEEEPSNKELLTVAIMISMNLWQNGFYEEAKPVVTRWNRAGQVLGEDPVLNRGAPNPAITDNLIDPPEWIPADLFLAELR